MPLSEFDALSLLPGEGGDEVRSQIENPAQPYESPQDTTNRQVSTARYAQQAYAAAERERATSNRLKAGDYAKRSIPTFTDEFGDVAPVTDATGSPVTKYDKRHNVGYDSAGAPVAVEYDGATGAPNLANPFDAIEPWTDPKSGDIYKRHPALPSQWVGEDPTIKARNLQKEQDRAVAEAARAKGAKLTSDEHRLHKEDVEFRHRDKEFATSFGPIDYEKPAETRKAIEASFKAQYDAPENNEKAGWFDSQFSEDTKARRAQIDQERARALATLDKLVATRATLAARKNAVDSLATERDSLLQRRAQSADRKLAGVIPGLDGAESGSSRSTARTSGETAPQSVDALTESEGRPQIPSRSGQENQEAALPQVGKGEVPSSEPTAIPGLSETQKKSSATAIADHVAAAQRGEKPYAIDAQGNFSLGESAPATALKQAVDDGLLPNPSEEVWKAAREKQSLVEQAGDNPKIKAALAGLGRGAAFMATAPIGAGAGAALGIESGPGAAVTGLIGGLIAGSAGAYGYGKVVEELAKHNDTINSFVASQKLHPGYAAAGEIGSFATGLPRAGMKAIGALAGRGADVLAEASQVAGKTAGEVRATVAAAKAAKAADPSIVGMTEAATPDILSRASGALDAIGSAYASSGGGLVATIENLTKLGETAAAQKGASFAAAQIAKRVGYGAAGMMAIDTAIKEGSKALGLSDQGQTAEGLGVAALLGVFASGHGIAKKGYSHEELGDILLRGMAHDVTGTKPGEVVDMAKLRETPDIGATVSESMTKPLTPEEHEIYSAFNQKAANLISEGKISADPAQWQARAEQILFAGRKGGIANVEITPKGDTETAPARSVIPGIDGPVSETPKPAETIQAPEQPSPSSGLEAATEQPPSPRAIGAPTDLPTGSQPEQAPRAAQEPEILAPRQVESAQRSPAAEAAVPSPLEASPTPSASTQPQQARSQKEATTQEAASQEPASAAPNRQDPTLEQQRADTVALLYAAKREGNEIGVKLHTAQLAKIDADSRASAPATSFDSLAKNGKFAADQTLGVPREQMPQVRSEHRGALANFLKARGMDWKEEEVSPSSLKPTQADFEQSRVEKAASMAGEPDQRRILISSDNRVIDGHHQWLAQLRDHPGKPMPALRIDAPAADILKQIHEFPSAGMEKAVDSAPEPETPARQSAIPGIEVEPAPAPAAVETPAAPEPTPAGSVIARSSGIRGQLRAEVARLGAKGEPAIFIDHQLITPRGKFSIDENGKLHLDQELSVTGFERNLMSIEGAKEGDDEWFGMNTQARARQREIITERTRKEEEETSKRIKRSEEESEQASRSSAYRAEIDATPLPTGVKGQVKIAQSDGNTRMQDGTIYGDVAIYKTTPVGREKPSYVVTHAPSGLSIIGPRVAFTLGEAKRFAQAIIHSGADLSAVKPSKEDLELAAADIRFLRSGEIPKRPAPHEGIATGQTVRLGKNPTVWTVAEKLAPQKGDLPDEKFYRVTNERGDEQVVESKDIKVVARRDPAEAKAAKAKREAKEEDLDRRLANAKMDPSVFPDAKSKRAALKRAAAQAKEKGDSGMRASLAEPAFNAPLRAAYDRLVAKDKWSTGAVSIGELARESGTPVKDLHETLLRLHKHGRVVLSRGDWSLSSPEARAAQLEVPGGDGITALQVRPLDPEVLSSKTPARPEDVFASSLREAAAKAPSEMDLDAQGKQPSTIEFNRPNGPGKLIVMNTREALQALADRYLPKKDSSHLQRIADAVEPLKQRIAPGLRIRVLRNEADLTQEERNGMSPTAIHEGVADVGRGNVYLFADNISSPQRAAEVFMHEVVGHYGIERLVGESDFQEIAKMVFKEAPIIAKKIAKQYAKKDSKFHQTGNFDDLSSGEKATIAREYVARLAEQPSINPSLWQRILAWLRKALRKLGIRREWTNAELRDLVRSARRAVETDAVAPRAGEGIRESTNPSDPIEVGTALVSGDAPIVQDLDRISDIYPDAEEAIVVEKNGTLSLYDLTGGEPTVSTRVKVIGDQAAIDALLDGDIPKVRSLDDLENEDIKADFGEPDKALVIKPMIGRMDLFGEDEEPIASAWLRPMDEDTGMRASIASDTTEAVEQIAKGTQPTRQDEKAAKAASQSGLVTNKAGAAMDKIKGSAKAVGDYFGKLAPVDENKLAKGEWLGAGKDGGPAGRQVVALQSRDLRDAIMKQFPNKLSRMAVVRYIEADGDIAELQRQEATSKAPFKPVYQRAQNLTPEEKQLASTMEGLFDKLAAQGKAADVLGDALENYVTHFVDQSSIPAKQKASTVASIMSGASTSKLKTKFDQGLRRTFKSMFDLEKAGYRLQSSDIAEVAAAYSQALGNTIIDRAFVRGLTTRKASDGRPSAVTSGYAKEILNPGGNAPLLVKPHVRPEDSQDYVAINHPALRKHKWVAKDAKGNDVFVEGDILVHPELAQDLKNTLSTSSLNKVPLVKGITALQSEAKHLMLGLSMFHYVQEGTHAIGHRVNPFKLHPIDTENPITRELMNVGLLLGMWDAKRVFGEGLASSSKVLGKVPWLGKFNDQVTNFLFEHYIPGLKNKMAEDAFARNLKAFSKDLASGKITRAQVARLTAQQANDAFGGQNNAYAGNNPSRLHAEQLGFLAPDFLKSRMKFFASAFTKYGTEQRHALLFLAITMMVTAKILERLMTGKNEWKKPFSVVTPTREYELRSVPGDVLEMVQDPRRFVNGRLSPLISRTTLEGITGRDWRGRKRTFNEQLMDAIKTPIPISIRGMIDKDAPELSAGEQVGNATGLRARRHSEITKARVLGHEWQKKMGLENADEVYPQSKYLTLRNALEDGNDKRAREAYAELLKAGDKQSVGKGFMASLMKPFSGSEKNEAKFVATLKGDDLHAYRAGMVSRDGVRRSFMRISGYHPKSGAATQSLLVAKPGSAVKVTKTVPLDQFDGFN